MNTFPRFSSKTRKISHGKMLQTNVTDKSGTQILCTMLPVFNKGGECPRIVTLCIHLTSFAHPLQYESPSYKWGSEQMGHQK
jgi:hypothetical protein